MDRKIDECYDSTYGVLMDRKIAERCASTIWCIDGKKKSWITVTVRTVF
jgi:hypothetical protein